jgi:photosystem II stability/assembly factor-like uncharacterized protein
MKLQITLLSIIIYIAGASRLAAQWTRVEAIPSVETQALHVDGDTLYVGAFDEVYFTTDGGAQWTPSAETDPENAGINDIIKVGGRLFIGTFGDGVFESSNNGQSWAQRSGGLTDTGAPVTIGFAARGDSLYLGTSGAGVYVLDLNGSTTWQPFRNGLPSNLSWNINSLFDNEGMLISGAGQNAAIYRNARNSNLWNEIEFAEFDPRGLGMMGLFKKSGVLLGGGSTGHLYRSANNGDEWGNFDTGIGITQLVEFAEYGETVFACLSRVGSSYFYQTLNAGESWEALDFIDAIPLAFDIAVYNNRLYVGSLDGLWYISLDPTAVAEEPRQPARFTLRQNYPNPFNPSTTINYEISEAGLVNLKIFDLLGREVRTLVDEHKMSGSYSVVFDAAGLSSGIYFYQLTNAGLNSQTHKMILMK